MLEIESGHIAELDDEMLRNLIGLLCEEELKSYGINVGRVLWGGNQNASDGGIDVYCEYEGEIDSNSFVPRNKVGFQVKLSDYAPSKIKGEMHKDGALKDSIKELCKENGAYILACGKSSVSEPACRNRINAMREAVQGNPGADNIYLDYYDSNRIATWVRKYPSMVVWAREKIDRSLQGWKSFGEWSDIQHKIYKTYILDQEKRVYDYLENQQITVLEGIQKFRNLIHKGAVIIRLTGLSGVGKTRFLEALFDKNVGTNALSVTKVIYADAANNLCPTTEQMLKELAMKGADVVVIIDNCSSSMHKQLMEVCRNENVRLSLITVEYDVGDENTEETAAFVLKPAADNVIEVLISKNFPEISPAVVRHLVELSGGNARLAFLLAKCGRDINVINDVELFRRLFWQKGREDTILEKTAEVFSLLYSVDYEDEGEDGELFRLSEMAGIKLRDAVRSLQELKNRDILQTRGKWCAILPHALSNYLAERSIQYYRGNEIRKTIIIAGTPRMKVSFAHRLSFLGNEEIAGRIAEDWLKAEFRDLTVIRENQAECFCYLARLKPDIALEYLERDWDMLQEYSYQTNRFISMVSDMAYYPEYFAQCIELLIKREKGNNFHTKARDYFQYNCYMDKHCTDVRLEKMKQWMEEGKGGLAFDCLEATLEQGYGNRVEYSDCYIHNKPIKRNTDEDEKYWFSQFIAYMEELVMDGKWADLLALKQFGDRFLALAGKGYGREIYGAVTEIRKRTFWGEGFTAVRRKLHFKNRYTDENVSTLQDLANILEPKNIEEEILYWCTSGTYELYDLGESIEEAEKKHHETVKRYGHILAGNLELFTHISKRLILSRAGLFLILIGRELAKSVECDKFGDISCNVLAENEYFSGNVYILQGLIADGTYDEKVKSRLAGLLENDALIPAYIKIVAERNFFQKEFKRFLQVIKEKKADIIQFNILSSCGGFLELPLDDFMLCIHALGDYADCGAVVFELLSSKLTNEKEINKEISEETKCAILTYLSLSTISLFSPMKNIPMDIMHYNVKTIITLTCGGGVNSSRDYIPVFYNWIKKDIENNYSGFYEISSIVEELYNLQPILFLETFIETVERNSNVCSALKDGYDKGPLSRIALNDLIPWCNQRPDERYNKVFDCISGYEIIEGTYQWRDCVLAALKNVQDRKALVYKLMKKIDPTFTGSSWSVEYERREVLFDLFERDKDAEIVMMVKNRRKEYQDITEQFRKSEKEREMDKQRFE